MDAVWTAFGLVFDPQVLGVVLASAVFGMFVGAIPGLTATMATALLVPITFFMSPVAALGAIVTATAMAIFAGDIPGAMLRMPGTPASAAYADETYKMSQRGELDLVMGVNLVFSVMGGLFGVVFLIAFAPGLAEVAINFSSFEYFWMACLGLTCAIFIGTGDPLKGLLSLFVGLAIATVGIDPAAGQQRFTFGNVDLLSGVDFIPAMIGMFAVSELLRGAVTIDKAGTVVKQAVGNMFVGVWGVWKKYWKNFFRGSAVGTGIGILPGAGADIAAWVSYAVSKKMSKEPEKFGTGHVEGVVDSTSANNSALGGAWIPALVFGIPGDSITAIVIGVLYMKGMNPGPTVFQQTPELIYAVFIIFVLANLIMLPLGWAAIKSAKQILRVPRNILMPIIIIFCLVGSFAMTNSLYGVVLMVTMGVFGWWLEEHGIPVAPLILGLILGQMVEQNFMSSMIKVNGSLIGFFDRPLAGTIGALTLLLWALMIWKGLAGKKSQPLPA